MDIAMKLPTTEDGSDENKSILLIEYNSYGTQGRSSAGLYNWRTDSYELYFAEEPSIRLDESVNTS